MASSTSSLVWSSSNGKQQMVHGDGPTVLSELDGQVHIVVTSPPYGVGMEYEEGVDLWEHKRLIERFAAACSSGLRPGGWAFVNFGMVWPAPYSMEGMYWQAFRDAGMELYCQRVWHKDFGSMSAPRAYHYKSPRPVAEHEHLWTFRKPTAAGQDKWDPPRDRSLSLRSVWSITPEHEKESDPSYDSSNSPLLWHPAAYPVTLPLNALRVHCDRHSEQLVVDPFGGRGTTAWACYLYDVPCVSIEIDADYCAKGAYWLQEQINVGEQQSF
jgi:DNA modification methylase